MFLDRSRAEETQLSTHLRQTVCKFTAAVYSARFHSTQAVKILIAAVARESSMGMASGFSGTRLAEPVKGEGKASFANEGQ